LGSVRDPSFDSALVTQTASDLFDRLLDLPDASRDTALEEELADSDAKAIAAKLLAAHRRTDGILDRLLVGSNIVPAAETLLGRRLGRWQLEAEIGRGGMAVVYRARSIEAPEAQVAAIKILTIGALAANLADRFRDEQAFLAQLNHPHIATLLDAGIDSDGTPWFAMALVEGQRIDHWCVAHALDIRARARLFLDVCAAIDYAHRHLIIHRDLKPSNVLVDDEGHVRLLDFGIARLASGDTTLTLSPALTPNYAAPEQFRGAAISVATDVYGLGAVFYAMLTGMPPRRDSGDRDALPPPPSQATGLVLSARQDLRGDLDAIVLKALAIEPDQRYPSAAALAHDVQSWLSGHPVVARAPTRRYLLTKFVKRHRSSVLGSAALLLALLAGAAGTTWQAIKARQQARQAADEAQRADAVRDFLLALFQANDPDQSGGNPPDLLTLLASGTQRAQERSGLPPRARAELLTALGTIYVNLGRYAEGSALFDQSISLWEKDTGTATSARYLPRLGRTEILSKTGNFRAALAESAPLLEALRHDSHVDTAFLSDALARLAQLRFIAGAGAPATRPDALEAVTRLRARTPQDPHLLADTLHVLAQIEQELNHQYEAERDEREAIALYEQIGPKANAQLRGSVNALALTLAFMNRHDEAVDYYERAVAIAREVYKRPHVGLARVQKDYAAELITHGRYAEAEQLLQESLQMERDAVGKSARLEGVLFQLARLREAQARYADAAAFLSEALSMVDVTQGSDNNLALISSLARVRWLMNETTEAERLFGDVAHRLDTVATKRVATRLQAAAAIKLAHFYVASNQYADALHWADAALAVSDAEAPWVDLKFVEASLLCAQALQGLGREAEAAARWQRASARLRSLQPANRYFAYEFYLLAAQQALDRGERAAADDLFSSGEAALKGRQQIPRLEQQRKKLLDALNQGAPVAS